MSNDYFLLVILSNFDQESEGFIFQEEEKRKEKLEKKYPTVWVVRYFQWEIFLSLM